MQQCVKDTKERLLLMRESAIIKSFITSAGNISKTSILLNQTLGKDFKIGGFKELYRSMACKKALNDHY